MFNPDRLKSLSGQKTAPGDFRLWIYDAADRVDAGQARNSLGYFPTDSGLTKGDAIYIRGGDETTHHWIGHNSHEKTLCLQLFGG